MAQIISASRRTDIPAFYTPWLLDRLQAGTCSYRHPFTRQWTQVSLLPGDVAGIVLWTKNLRPLLPHLEQIRKRYVFYVQFTINGYPRELEPNIPPAGDAIACARTLSSTFGPGSLVWRFDPIVHTDRIGPLQTLSRFISLADLMAGLTDTCVISFMSPYQRQKRAFTEAGIEHREPSAAERIDLAGELARIAADRGIGLQACCNPDILGGMVHRAHCVDARRLKALGAPIDGAVPAAPSREGCGCSRSVDIGAYDTCPGGCAYCYANQNHGRAARNHALHETGRASIEPGT